MKRNKHCGWNSKTVYLVENTPFNNINVCTSDQRTCPLKTACLVLRLAGVHHCRWWRGEHCPPAPDTAEPRLLLHGSSDGQIVPKRNDMYRSIADRELIFKNIFMNIGFFLHRHPWTGDQEYSLYPNEGFEPCVNIRQRKIFNVAALPAMKKKKKMKRKKRSVILLDVSVGVEYIKGGQSK